MGLPKSGRNGAYVTRRVGKGSHVMRTIVTPEGSFRTISKEVLDRAMRSANTALQQGASKAGDADDDVRQR